jgi:hypothetical protein
MLCNSSCRFAVPFIVRVDGLESGQDILHGVELVVFAPIIGFALESDLILCLSILLLLQQPVWRTLQSFAFSPDKNAPILMSSIMAAMETYKKYLFSYLSCIRSHTCVMLNATDD